MAKFYEFDEQQQKELEEWIESRPTVVANMVRLRPMNVLYRLDDQGNDVNDGKGSRVQIYSYSEDGTVTVAVLARWNKLLFERRVFGIRPDQLVECDLPGPDEELGAVLKTEEEISEYIRQERIRRGFAR